MLNIIISVSNPIDWFRRLKLDHVMGIIDSMYNIDKEKIISNSLLVLTLYDFAAGSSICIVYIFR